MFDYIAAALTERLRFFAAIALGIAAVVLVAVSFHIAQRVPSEVQLKPVSAVILQQCGKVIGALAVDQSGGLHPVPPEEMSDNVVDQLVRAVGEGHYQVATAPCLKAEPII